MYSPSLRVVCGIIKTHVINGFSPTFRLVTVNWPTLTLMSLSDTLIAFYLLTYLLSWLHEKQDEWNHRWRQWDTETQIKTDRQTYIQCHVLANVRQCMSGYSEWRLRCTRIAHSADRGTDSSTRRQTHHHYHHHAHKNIMFIITPMLKNHKKQNHKNARWLNAYNNTTATHKT